MPMPAGMVSGYRPVRWYIDEIEPDGMVADADLTGAGLAHGHVNELEFFGATGLADLDGEAHGVHSPAVVRDSGNDAWHRAMFLQALRAQPATLAV
jgi:hypothetical protein